MVGYNKAMRSIRRTDYAARIELLPLIDVIFLLLTFFIYTMIVMRFVQVLPVDLTPVEGGQDAARGIVHAVTIDAEGEIFLDKEPITMDALRSSLAELAGSENPGTLYVAAQSSDPSKNQLPVFLQVMQIVDETGVTDVKYVW